MRRRLSVLTAVLATAAASTLASPAAASLGTASPAVSLPSPAFVVGSAIGASGGTAGGITESSYTSGITRSVRWTAGDADGVCASELSRLYAGGDPESVASAVPGGSYLDSSGDYDGSLGGGSFVPTGWSATATDCAGNAATLRTLSRIGVLQEDSTSATLEEPAAVRAAGAWRASSCTCWSGGATRWTVTRGASTTVVRTWADAGHVALVMATGPDRGAVTVSVDGGPAVAVDTRAPAAHSRVVVWQQALAAGRHTVVVAAQGTEGRARVDLDAVLVD